MNLLMNPHGRYKGDGIANNNSLGSALHVLAVPVVDHIGIPIFRNLLHVPNVRMGMFDRFLAGAGVKGSFNDFDIQHNNSPVIA